MKRHRLFCGDAISSISLPEDAEIVSAPAPLEALPDWEAALRSALEAPIGYPSLPAIVKPRHFITIAFDDPCLPLPLMKRDVRAVIAERLVERLLALGVKKERIQFLCANGLHRKWTERELSAVMGTRIVSQFRYGHQLTCHDAEDPANLRDLGTTERGEAVEVNKAVTESDAIFYISVVWTSMNGGWKSIAVGLGSYRSITCHHNPAVLLSGGSLVEPHTSGMHESIAQIGRMIERHSRVIQIEVVLNTKRWAGPITPLLSLDRPLAAAAGRTVNLFPATLRGALIHRVRSAYEPVSVSAGKVDAVHEKSLSRLFPQQNVAIREPFDIAVVGLPNMSPYSAFSRMNPLLVMNLGLGYVFNLYRGRPLIRKGGVMIIVNPCKSGFHRQHHLPYVDFFDRVLPQTLDPLEMHSRFEPAFARCPRYIEAYRHRLSYHGSHPFFAWYWGARAMAHLGMVIFAKAEEPEVVRRMGFAPAASVPEALAMASDVVGAKPSVVLLRIPPLFAADLA